MVSRKASRRTVVAGISLALVGGMMVPAAWASGPDETALDAAALVQMEQRAQHADPREQCFLYTQVLHALTESAGREMAAGEDTQLNSTLAEIDAVMAKMQSTAVVNAKRLKNAEELLEHTQHRLADMTRVATSDELAPMKLALAQLTSLHNRVLSVVFAQ